MIIKMNQDSSTFILYIGIGISQYFDDVYIRIDDALLFSGGNGNLKKQYAACMIGLATWKMKSHRLAVISALSCLLLLKKKILLILG